MSKSINEVFYSKENAEKIEQFEKRLLEIEDEYIHFFKKRDAIIETEEHDRLHNHTLQKWDTNGIHFGFKKDSPVPKEIRNACLSVFDEIFNNSKK